MSRVIPLGHHARGLLLPFGVTIARWELLGIGAAMILMVNVWARHRTVHLPETCEDSLT